MRYAAMTSEDTSPCAKRMRGEAVDTARIPRNRTIFGELLSNVGTFNGVFVIFLTND